MVIFLVFSKIKSKQDLQKTVTKNWLKSSQDPHTHRAILRHANNFGNEPSGMRITDVVNQMERE